MRSLKASTTIEMAYIMPGVFLVISAVIYISFYFHDKAVINGIAAEAAAVSGRRERMEEELTEAKVADYVRAQTRKKMIFFPAASVSVSFTENESVVIIETQGHGMKLQTKRRGAVTRPEKRIRSLRKIKDVIQE